MSSQNLIALKRSTCAVSVSFVSSKPVNARASARPLIKTSPSLKMYQSPKSESIITCFFVYDCPKVSLIIDFIPFMGEQPE